MKIRLAYGETGLDVDLPDDRTTVVEPVHVAGTKDPRGVLRSALQSPVAGPPLRQIVRPGQSVAISVCDGTRAQPRHLMVPAVLEEIADVVDIADVVVLVATDTHRGNTEAELRAMLGDAVVDRVRVVNHDARDDESLVWMGVHGNGVPVWLNRHWVEAGVHRQRHVGRGAHRGSRRVGRVRDVEGGGQHLHARARQGARSRGGPGQRRSPGHHPHAVPRPAHRRRPDGDDARGIPMGRPGRPEDCVGAVLFLASPAMSGYVTGQVLEVNGGQLTP